MNNGERCARTLKTNLTWTRLNRCFCKGPHKFSENIFFKLVKCRSQISEALDWTVITIEAGGSRLPNLEKKPPGEALTVRSPTGIFSSPIVIQINFFFLGQFFSPKNVKRLGQQFHYWEIELISKVDGLGAPKIESRKIWGRKKCHHGCMKLLWKKKWSSLLLWGWDCRW